MEAVAYSLAPDALLGIGNAERLGIRTVIYRDRIWTARRSMQGWREYRFSGPDPDNPVNRHLDHVHVDVA